MSLRIAVITGRGCRQFGGIETYIHEVYTRLADRGHHITIYTRRGDGLPRPLINPVRHIHYRVVPHLALPHLDAFSHCLLSTLDARHRQFDLVCYHGSPAALSSVLPMQRDTRKVAIIHGLDWLRWMKHYSPHARLIQRTLQASEFVAARNADHLVAISPYLQRHLTARWNTPAACIPPGVNHYTPEPAHEILQQRLSPLGYMLYLGRLTPEKGCHLLIQAYRSINTAVKLVIAGPSTWGFGDSYERYLRQLPGGDRRIVFTGTVRDTFKAELLSNALLVVYPATVGGLPLAILEAMSYRRCVLVSDICDYYPLLREHAVLFPTGDAIELARELRALLDDPDACQTRGQQAHAAAMQMASWGEVAQRFEQLFMYLIGQRNLPRAEPCPAYT